MHIDHWKFRPLDFVTRGVQRRLRLKVFEQKSFAAVRVGGRFIAYAALLRPTQRSVQ
jgi:hypothetical protein